MSVSLGVDVGGTFTDFVSIDDKRRVSFFKTLTTPDDPSRAILDGTSRFARARNDAVEDVSRVIHGTTLVANSLIERHGARTALITTEGFRDVIEIAREARYDIYDLALERPEPLVPRPLRLEVRGRILADGSELTPLDEAAVRRIADELQRRGVESVAVVFLHAYANPLHEQQAARILHDVAPDIDVTLSSEVAPEWREYERTCTAAANAFVRPLVRRYLLKLEDGLRGLNIPDKLSIMMSHGGVTSPSVAGDYAVQLVESGPVGGVMAAAYFGRRAGLADIIAFDMGGTTTKVSVIKDGIPLGVTELEVARVARFKRGSGIPLKISTVELIEIGAGGGSIGRRDDLGLLKVGPKSASAVPGPACYDRGGTRATVTDADLHLGFLDPDYFLGGEMALHPHLAEHALADLGAELGIDATGCARGIYDVVNRQMALAMRTHIVERGFDPRHFTLFATGGAGPLHAYELARHLGIARILCPPGAGVASALGFLVSPFSVDLVRTLPMRLGAVDWKAVEGRYAAMEKQAVELLTRAGSDAADAVFERRVDMRYAGQGYEVPVALSETKLDPSIEGALRDRFEQAYRRRFGTSLATQAAEALHWRLSVRIQTVDGELTFPVGAAGEALKGSRSVLFAELPEAVECPVYDRYRLVPGQRLTGPLLIQERESTIAVGPSANAELDALGNIQITFRAAN